MKKTTDQIEFERLISIYHQQHQNDLKLANPSFGCYNSAISKATMSGSGGFVEILYGPPDFHVELFITSSKEKRRWELRDLMSIGTVRAWLVNYSQQSIPQGKSHLEREVEWIFLILIDGLKGIANFAWLK